MRLTQRNTTNALHCAAVVGLVVGLIKGAWDVVGVILIALLTAHIATGRFQSSMTAVRLTQEQGEEAQAEDSDISAPTTPASEAAADTTSPLCVPERPTRVPLYKESDWDFVKPTPWSGMTKQNFLRPSQERVVEPLGARQAFVKEWASDSNAFAVKDRYTIPVGGTQKIDRRF